jgi:hypothetical protein
MHARDIISTHPDVRGNASEALVRCIEECYACAQACIACADACVAEEMVQQLRQCIRLNVDCTDVCLATGALASRRTGSNEQILGRCFRSARPPAGCAERSASATQDSTSTAAFAPRFAADASRRARRRCGTSAEPAPIDAGAVGAAGAPHSTALAILLRPSFRWWMP